MASKEATQLSSSDEIIDFVKKVIDFFGEFDNPQPKEKITIEEMWRGKSQEGPGLARALTRLMECQVCNLGEHYLQQIDGIHSALRVKIDELPTSRHTYEVERYRLLLQQIISEYRISIKICREIVELYYKSVQSTQGVAKTNSSLRRRKSRTSIDKRIKVLNDFYENGDKLNDLVLKAAQCRLKEEEARASTDNEEKKKKFLEMKAIAEPSITIAKQFGVNFTNLQWEMGHLFEYDEPDEEQTLNIGQIQNIIVETANNIYSLQNHFKEVTENHDTKNLTSTLNQIVIAFKKIWAIITDSMRNICGGSK